MSLAKKLKTILKKETFGTDPRDPWSVKSNIAEDASLTAYLKSKGINPDFVYTTEKIGRAHV